MSQGDNFWILTSYARPKGTFSTRVLFLRSTTLLMRLHRLGITGLNVCGYIHVSFELFLIKLSKVLVGITPSGKTSKSLGLLTPNMKLLPVYSCFYS